MNEPRDDGPGLERTLIVNTGAMRPLRDVTLERDEDRAVAQFFDAVKRRLEEADLTDVELRLTTGDGLKLSVGPPSKVGATDWPAYFTVGGATREELLDNLELELEQRAAEDRVYGPDEPDLVAGADSPTISGTGERLLGEADYAGMRSAVLNVAQALGAIDVDMFDALLATCERSVGPGLDQAVAAGDIPLDKLGPMRDALALELRLFRCARTFRQGIASVQEEVRRHVAGEEERAGAPPAIEVIRRNAEKNGGGT